MSANTASVESLKHKLNRWLSSTPPQFIAFHALCRGALTRLGDSTGAAPDTSVIELNKLEELESQLRALAAILEDTKRSLNEIEGSIPRSILNLQASLKAWSAATNSSLISFGRTVTQLEQATAATEKARSLQREAHVRSATLRQMNLLEETLSKLSERKDPREQLLRKEIPAWHAEMAGGNFISVLSAVTQAMQPFQAEALENNRPSLGPPPPAIALTPEEPPPSKSLPPEPAPVVDVPVAAVGPAPAGLHQPAVTSTPERLVFGDLPNALFHNFLHRPVVTPPAEQAQKLETIAPDLVDPLVSPIQTAGTAPSNAETPSHPVEAPLQIATPLTPTLAEPISLSEPPTKNLVDSTYQLENLDQLLNRCETFDRYFDEFKHEMIPLRELNRQLQEDPAKNSNESLRQLGNQLTELLKKFQTAATVEVEKTTASLSFKFDWAKTFPGELPTSSMKLIEDFSVETAKDLRDFRRSAKSLEEALHSHISSNPGSMGDILHGAIEEAKALVTSLQSQPRYKKTDDDTIAYERRIPRFSSHTPGIDKWFLDLETCASIKQALLILTAQNDTQLASLRDELAELRQSEKDARDFSACHELTSYLPAETLTAIEDPDKNKFLNETSERMHQVRVQMQQSESDIRGRLQEVWKSLIAECKSFQLRVRKNAAELPEPPAAHASWKVWDAALLAAKARKTQLGSQYVEACSLLNQHHKEAKERLKDLVSSTRWKNHPELRRAHETLNRLNGYVDLDGPVEFAQYDALSGEVDIATNFLERVEGAERRVRDALLSLDNRLNQLLEEGLEMARPAAARRATSLIEGLRHQVESPAVDWDQSEFQSRFIGDELKRLELDYAQLASGWMESLAGRLTTARQGMKPSPLRERIDLLLEDIRSAGPDRPPSGLLRRRLESFLEAAGLGVSQ